MNKTEFKKFAKTVSAELELIDGDKADEYLEHNINNRDPKTKKIMTLVQAMMEGRFLYTGDTIKFDRDGNVVDGQNRLIGISKSRIPQPVLVVRGLDPEAAKFMDVGSKRQLKDWLQFMQVEFSSIIAPSLRALDPYYVKDAPKRIGDGLMKYEVPIDKSLILFKKIRKNLEASAKWAFENKKGNDLSPAQTCTLHHVLTEIDEEFAIDFLNELCVGVGVDRESPTWILRNHIAELKRDAKARGSSVNPNFIYKMVIITWNYWIQDFEMPIEALSKSADFPAPIIPE